MGKGGVYGGATVLLNGRAAWHFFVHARSLKAQVIPPHQAGHAMFSRWYKIECTSANNEGPSMT